MTSQVTLLDCTLRDGGYVNNWEFDTDTSLKIMKAVYDSGVRLIELGIMGRGGVKGKQTKFVSFEDARELLDAREKDCKYTIMVTQAESKYISIPEKTAAAPEIIRLAYFKQERSEALKTAKELMDKGYTVFFQAMATFLYTKEEYLKMLEEVNRLKPAAFYMVDSFSTMYKEDVHYWANLTASALSPDIGFGFHAHNNMQMAYANVIEYMKLMKTLNRDVYIDGSIFGMGRGAGNVPTELLMYYCNTRYGAKYDSKPLLKAFQDILLPIYKQYGWGYSLPNLLTATKSMNSAYAWFLSTRGITDILAFDEIMDAIPEEKRYTLMKDVVVKLIEEYKEKHHD